MGRESKETFYGRYTRPWHFFFSTVGFLLPLAGWAIQEYGRTYAAEYHFVHLPGSLGSIARLPLISNVLDILIPSSLILSADAIVFWLVSWVPFTLSPAQLRGVSRPSFSRVSDKVGYVTAAAFLVMAPIFFAVFLFQSRNPSWALHLRLFTDVLIMGLFLYMCTVLSHCVPCPSEAKWTRRFSSWLAILTASVLLMGCYSLLARTGLFRSPIKEATIMNNELLVMGNMWVLKDRLIKTSNQTGVPPSASIEKIEVDGESYDYVFRVIPREFGEFSIVGISEKYGDAGSGRRSFFLDCVGGVIRGIDPEHQESVQDSIVSSESLAVASENDYFPSVLGHMNKDAVPVQLVRGRKTFAHDEEISFFASTLVRRVAYEADMTACACVSNGSFPPQAVTDMKSRVHQLASLTGKDLTRLQLASKDADFRRESDFVKLKAYVESKVSDVENRCAPDQH